MRSQSGIAALLASGRGEDELGLTEMRAVAAQRMTEPATWWWTYRIRLGVKAAVK
jgi:hypothetical protein